MSTARSPLRQLRAEADRMAARIKGIERGDVSIVDPAGKIAAAKQRDQFTFGVVMDDKVLKITMSWATIRESTEAGISEYILRQMREDREQAN